MTAQHRLQALTALLIGVLSVACGEVADREDHLLTKSGFRDNLALETALEFAGVTRPLIDTLVSRLRHKLKDTSKTPRFIKTVWGRGYTFVGEQL